MNSMSADRQTAKELKEQRDGIASQRKHTVEFINNPERRLLNARIGVASLRVELARREAELQHLEATLANPDPIVDAYDARIKQLTQEYLKAKMKERVQRWHRLTAEKSALENGSEIGNPEKVDEEMIIS